TFWLARWRVGNDGSGSRKCNREGGGRHESDEHRSSGGLRGGRTETVGRRLPGALEESDSMTIDDLEYREYEPPPSIGAFVRCLWTLEGPATAGGAPQPVVPDGCMELIINLADPFRRQGGDGVSVEQPLEMLVGQLTGPAVIVPSGAVNLIGVRLHPWGAAAFLGLPDRELARGVYALRGGSRALSSPSARV